MLKKILVFAFTVLFSNQVIGQQVAFYSETNQGVCSGCPIQKQATIPSKSGKRDALLVLGYDISGKNIKCVALPGLAEKNQCRTDGLNFSYYFVLAEIIPAYEEFLEGRTRWEKLDKIMAQGLWDAISTDAKLKSLSLAMNAIPSAEMKTITSIRNDLVRKGWSDVATDKAIANSILLIGLTGTLALLQVLAL